MIKKKAFAKLNLNLHINPDKNINGYHQVRFINTQLALHDELIFEPTESGVEVICKHKEMPPQEQNLVYKAATLLREMDPKKRGIRITIKKNIPIRAGLGGGSSDAAVTIQTLAQLWKININKEQQKKLADVLGKDVHYLLSGGLAEVEGDGDKVTVLPFNLSKFWVVIIVPGATKPSTGWMYSRLDKAKVGQHIHYLPKLKESIRAENKKEFLNYIFNDFEHHAFKHFPVTLEMKQDLEDAGATTSLLCGSGLSMIGFFTSKTKAVKAKELLKDKYKDVIISKLN